jgi:hypothetical protein
MLLDEMYSNHFTKNHYFDLDNNLVSAGFAISGEHRGNTFIELEDFEMDEVDIAQSFVDVDGYYNNKLYVSVDFRNSTAARINKYLAVYNDSKDTIDNVEYKFYTPAPFTGDTAPYAMIYDVSMEDEDTIKLVAGDDISRYNIIAYDENQIIFDVYNANEEGTKWLYKKMWYERKVDNTKWWEDAK